MMRIKNLKYETTTGEERMKKGLTKSLNCFITLINIIKHVLRYDSLAAGCCQFKFFSSKHRKLYVCIMHFPVTRWDICVWKNSSCRVCLRKLMFAPLWDCWVMKSFRICLKITSASLIWFDDVLRNSSRHDIFSKGMESFNQRPELMIILLYLSISSSSVTQPWRKSSVHDQGYRVCKAFAVQLRSQRHSTS